jgi:ammonia channel protein AmtB
LSEFELHVLITDHLRDMHAMIEFWVSATFAVIVARFVAGDRLNRAALRAVAVLYFMATLLSFTRYNLLAWRMREYRNDLIEAGMRPFAQPQPQYGMMAVLVFGLYGLGTVATLYFLLGRRWAGSASNTQ